jgi:signal transduction histidine kinase/YHS domain-containing protein
VNDWFHVALAGLVLLAATNTWLVFRVLKPLRRLAAQADEVSKGNLAAFQQPCGGIPEIGLLRQTMASMAGHVRRSQQEGAAHRHALSDGQEAERTRIARELHDDTVQSLVAIAQSIDLATHWIEQDPAHSLAMLKTARTQAVGTVDGLRRLIANLRPPALEELGLMAALTMLADSDTDTKVTVEAAGEKRRLDEARELTLFRAAQEGIRNAQRHGRANHIQVEVDFQPDAVRLTVKDDGVGFRLPNDLHSLAEGGHYGLPGLHERVEHLNGEVHVSSRPGQGTELIVTLPLERLDQPTQAVCDPVCGAVIQPQQAYGSMDFEGQRYYFCCPVCQGAFRGDPHTYLASKRTQVQTG